MRLSCGEPNSAERTELWRHRVSESTYPMDEL